MIEDARDAVRPETARDARAAPASDAAGEQSESDEHEIVTPATNPVVAGGAPQPAAARVAALLQVIAVSGFPTQLAIGGILTLVGMHPLLANGRLSTAYVGTVWAIDTVLVLALIYAFLRLAGERPGAVLLGAGRVASDVVIGVLLVPLVFLLVAVFLLLLQAVAPWLHNVAHNPLEGLMRSPRDAWLLAILAVFSGGFREEVQRAFILHRFEQHLGGPIVGLVVFSGAFGAGHLIQGWDVALTTTVLGAFWGVIYLWRRSIVAPVVSHAGFNLVEIFRYTLLGA